MNDDATPVRDRIAVDAIPGYRVIELIDRGGMGGVYLAEDATLKRQVAIKLISAEWTDSAELKRRFRTEARIIAAFQHPNIVTVYASGWIGESQYLVMEYLPGGTLTHRLQRQRLKPLEAYRIARRLADALAYSHEREVVHRDLKPSNILMRSDGTPVLSDFGIAKTVMVDAAETTLGMVMGSKRYMAPEQAQGEKVSASADIYSFGLMLHEMLMGEVPALHPIRTRDDARVVMRGMRAIDGDAVELITRCLQLQANGRPTATECREVLDRVIAKSLPEHSRRRRIMAMAVVLLAAATFWTLSRSRQGARDSQAVASASLVGRSPANTQVYIDGQLLDMQRRRLEPGNHMLAAIAPGYYGTVQTLSADAAHRDIPIDVQLRAVSLPSQDEFNRFLKLSDSPVISAADLQSITEATLRISLQVQRQQQTDDVEGLDRLMREVSTLRRLGDARAAVAGLLIDSMRLGKISESVVTPALTQASARGDAMASLFLALALRDSLNRSSSPVTPSDSRMRSYCEQLKLAAKQGWSSVADDFQRRDRCP